LFRVYRQTIWLGPDGMGRIVVFFPANNALLYRNTLIDTRLLLAWQGNIVARSLGGSGRSEAMSDNRGRMIGGKYYEQAVLRWNAQQTATPVLLIQRQIKRLFSLGEFVAGAAGLLVVLTLFIWPVLGVWIVRTTRRLAGLGEASRQFAANYQLTPEIRRQLNDSCAGRQDEITEVARSLEGLTQAVAEHTREREIREKALRESEARIREITAAVADGLCVLDYQGVLVFINPEAERLLGWRADEIIGRNAYEVLSCKNPDGTPYHLIDECGVTIAYKTGVTYRSHEERIACRDGGFLPVSLSASPIFRDGKIAGMVIAFQDISELKRVEAALKQSEADYQAILDAMHDTFFRIRLVDGRFMAVSRSAIALLGYEANELIGTGFYELLAGPDEQAAFLRALEEENGRLFDHEMVLRGKDGLVVWVSANAHHYLDESGAVVGIEGTLRNIMQRRRMEEALRRSQVELELRVAQRTVDLQQAKEEAERANAAKSEFLSRMSHELRTPLNAVLGFAQLMENDPTDPLSPDHRENIRHILNGGWQLLALVNEVLDLSGIEQGKLELVLESADVQPVVAECVSLLSPQAAKRGIRVVNDVAAHGPVWVIADQARFRQVLMNLLSNAVKYNQKNGEIVLSCASQSDGAVRFSVSDSGSGIPQDQLGQLFKPFSRLAINKNLVDGTGVGLSLVKRLVELMGGVVGVESEPGKGSTFWIELKQVRSVV
jgi:PAS domain S-box-containing protein